MPRTSPRARGRKRPPPTGRRPPAAALPLAKLSPPRLIDAVPRERLLGLLDRLLEHPVAWIPGPPGAGKTTLAAMYAQARGRPVAWYQVDRGDDDVASFFHYFERAVAAHGHRRRKPLPRFVPEFHANVAAFARGFAREAWARLPPRALLVLDNVHEASSPAFAQMLAALIGEMPPGVSMIVVSRAEPGPELAGLLAGRRIARLDPRAIGFTMAEAARLLARRPMAAQEVARLHRTTQGWAAGLILLSEGAADDAGPGAARTPEALFGYFATQVVGRLPASSQRFLAMTALLPRLTAEVGDALAGTRDGAAILDSLRRQNLFVGLRDEDGSTYQYHDLFRAFLRERARALLAPAEFDRTLREGAALAEANGWHEDAVELSFEALDWEGAARFLEARGPALLAQGRARTVEAWIDRLPPAFLAQRAALAFMLGQARIQRDEIAAREAFSLAYDACVRDGDEPGTVLAACAALETVFTSFRDWTGGRHWIAAVRRHFPRVARWPRRLDRLQAHAGMFLALMMSADRDDGEVERVIRVLVPLLDDDAIDVNDRLRVAATIVDTCARSPQRRAIFAQVDPIAQRLLEHPASSPLIRARYLMDSADEASAHGDHDAAQRQIDRARAIVEEHGWRHMRFVLACRDLRIAFYRRDLETCDARLADVDQLIEPGSNAQETLRAVLHYHRDMLKGDRRSALGHARTAARLGEADLPTADYCNVLHLLAYALLAEEDFAGAAEVFAKCRGLSAGFAAEQQRVHRHLALAAAIADGVPNAPLAKALALARAMGERDFLPHLPALASALCARALRQEIEPRFVGEVITARGFLPPDPDDPHWPWALRIRTLGGFAVLREGRPMASAAKPARRPLDLLMFIASSGRREVSAPAAIAALWPELDGDRAKSAFNVALHRLRRLLGVEESVALEGGRLVLSAAHVWVDAFAFERYVAEAEAMLARNRVAEGEAAANIALGLYGGHFLDAEEDTAWQLIHRSRLSARYVRLVVVAARHWMHAGDFPRARRTCERAIELEPLAEEVYRTLMEVLAARGQPAEALRVYRRCREALSVALGIPPSAQTELVHDALRRK